MRSLSVGAIFRNEQHAIAEWIEHYLLQGVVLFDRRQQQRWRARALCSVARSPFDVQQK